MYFTRIEVLLFHSKWASLHGQVVKFVCSLLWWPRVHWFGSWAQTYTLLIMPYCGSMPHRRSRMTCNYNIQLCTGALRNKKEEYWQQMLTQGNLPHQKKKKKKQKHQTPIMTTRLLHIFGSKNKQLCFLIMLLLFRWWLHNTITISTFFFWLYIYLWN